MLLHKLREAMAEELKGRVLGGEGKVAEVDGGYVKPANFRQNRKDRRLRHNQSGKRKVVVVVRRQSNGDQVNRLAGLAMKRKPSVDFSGYWQRHHSS